MCALRFLDSFDHYTSLAQKYTVYSGSVVAAALRTGIQGLRYIVLGDNQAQLTLDAQATWILGFAYRTGNIATAPRIIAETLDAGVVQGSLRLNVDGTLSLLRGTAAVVATSVRSLISGVYYYIEFKHIINNVAGTLEVRVDGVVWATFAGDTQQTGAATANGICIGHIGTTFCSNDDRDDYYVLDGVDQSIADPNSPPNNDYLGDTQVQALVPVGAGAYTELATLVGAPTHWQAEDEVPPDEDTSYVEDAVVDRRDTFAMTNLAVVSAIVPGIQILTRARKTAAGVANFARLYRNAAADNQGADTVLQESYAYHREILGGDPIAAGAWVVANINSMEMGFRTR